jgi:hypothetical protein
MNKRTVSCLAMIIWGLIPLPVDNINRSNSVDVRAKINEQYSNMPLWRHTHVGDGLTTTDANPQKQLAILAPGVHMETTEMLYSVVKQVKLTFSQ